MSPQITVPLLFCFNYITFTFKIIFITFTNLASPGIDLNMLWGLASACAASPSQTLEIAGFVSLLGSETVQKQFQNLF